MPEDTVLAMAKRAIDLMFSDTSVPKERTKERLEELRDEIDSLLDTL